MARKHTPIHLRPHAPVAERVLVPGDPGRALRLAQELMDGPKMLNHHRGLWGYSGPSKSDGRLLTVQSSGLGGPSAAAVVADLAALGARRMVRIGTCHALGEEPAPGDLVVVLRARAPDGTRVDPDEELTAGLRRSLPHAPVLELASVDFAHVAAPAGSAARDTTSAGFLQAAERHGLPAAVGAIVAATPSGRLDDEVLHPAEATLGRAALSALGARP